MSEANEQIQRTTYADNIPLSRGSSPHVEEGITPWNTEVERRKNKRAKQSEDHLAQVITLCSPC